MTAKQLEATRRWRKLNPESQKRAQRKQHLKSYGLSVEGYDALVAAQDGRCAVCGVLPAKQLNVDHDHGTGKVRGLLCSPCNLGLGHFGDSPETLAKAIAYLRRKTP